MRTEVGPGSEAKAKVLLIAKPWPRRGSRCARALSEDPVETTVDLYKRGKDIGFTAQSNQPKSSKKKVKSSVKKPKVNKPKIKSEFLERINKGYEGGLNLKKENIVSKSVEDDTIILKLKDFTVDDGEEIDILNLVQDSKFDGFNAYLIQTVEFNNKISEQEYDAFFIY